MARERADLMELHTIFGDMMSCGSKLWQLSSKEKVQCKSNEGRRTERSRGLVSDSTAKRQSCIRRE